MRRGAVLLLALLALPSAASARGCSSADVPLTDARCETGRPVPSIMATPSTPRAGATVTLNGQSGGRGLAYAWDLDDDGAFDDATGADARLTPAVGAHTVKLRVTDADGRVGIATTTLHAHAANLAPGGMLTIEPASARVGQTVRITGTANDGDGALAAIDFDLDDDGDYEVRRTVSGTDTSETASTTFATAGTRTIRARVRDDAGATRVMTSTLEVGEGNHVPALTLSAPAEARVDADVQLIAVADDVDGAIARVDFDLDGDGVYETGNGAARSVTKRFTAAGTHVIGVQVTDDAGAVATSRRSIEITTFNEPPAIQLIRPGTASRDLQVQASDGDGIAEYAWDLDDDGEFDDLVGPSATVASVPDDVLGEVTLAVRVTDRAGASDVARTSFALTDHPPDTPSLYVLPRQPRVGESVTIGVYGSATGDVDTVAWDLHGTGFDAPSRNIGTTASFADAGVHTALARVTDSRGRTAIGRVDFTVAPATGPLPPFASISALPARPGEPMEVYVSDWSSSVKSFAWDFDGDGEFDDGTRTYESVTFASAGEHEVALRVTDASGATFTQRRFVTVHAEHRPPFISLGTLEPVPQTLPVGHSMTMSTAVMSDAPISAMDWDTDGDGEFDDATGFYPRVEFPAAGDFRVRVRATDRDGMTATATYHARVRAPVQRPPVLFVRAPGGRVPPGVSYPLSVDVGDFAGDIVWDADGDGAFDDGAGLSIQHAWPVEGTYDVRVRADDGHGNVREALRSVSVGEEGVQRAPRILSLTLPGSAQAGREVAFYAMAPSETPLWFSFDLDGDGEFDDQPREFGSFYWTFSEPGTKTVAVKVTDPAGRAAIRTAQVTVVDQNTPPATWLLAGALPAAGTPFSLQGFASDREAMSSIAWDLDGDGAFDDAAWNPVTVTFPSAGTYTVGLRAIDDGGLTSTSTVTVTAGSRPPVASFEPDGGTLRSTASDPDGDALTFAWDLDGDGAFDDATGPSAAAAFTGEREVGLKARDAGGDIGIVYRAVTGSGAAEPTASPTPEATATPAATASPTPSATPEATATPAATASPTPSATPAPGDLKPADATAPRLTAVWPKARLATALKRGIPLRVTCSEACRLTLTATLDKATAKRLKLGTRVGRVTRSLRAGARTTLAVKLAGRALKRQRSLKVTLTVVAVDAAGNRRTLKRTLRLRG